MPHEKERLDSFFAGNMLDAAGAQTNIHADIASTLQLTARIARIFSQRLTMFRRGGEWISL